MDLDWLEFVKHWEWWHVLLVVIAFGLVASSEGRRILAFGIFLPLFWISERMSKRGRRR